MTENEQATPRMSLSEIWDQCHVADTELEVVTQAERQLGGVVGVHEWSGQGDIRWEFGFCPMCGWSRLADCEHLPATMKPDANSGDAYWSSRSLIDGTTGGPLRIEVFDAFADDLLDTWDDRSAYATWEIAILSPTVKFGPGHGDTPDGWVGLVVDSCLFRGPSLEAPGIGTADGFVSSGIFILPDGTEKVIERSGHPHSFYRI